MSSYDGSVVPRIPNMKRSSSNSRSKIGACETCKASCAECMRCTDEVDRRLGTAVVKCCTDCNNDPGSTRSSRNARCLDCFKTKARGSKVIKRKTKRRGSKSMKRRGSKSKKRRGSKSMKRRGRKSVKRRGMKKRRK